MRTGHLADVVHGGVGTVGVDAARETGLIVASRAALQRATERSERRGTLVALPLTLRCALVVHRLLAVVAGTVVRSGCPS